MIPIDPETAASGTAIASSADSSAGEKMETEHIVCPSCGKSYPVPLKLRQKGRLQVRCPGCGKRFQLRHPEAQLPEVEVPISAAEGETQAEDQELPTTTANSDAMGDLSIVAPQAQDPALLARRSKRLARALISDLLRGREVERKISLEEGTIILIFGDSIRRAWEEFGHQAPADFEDAPRYFREALNEILAEGKPLF